MTEKELIGKVHSAVYHQCQRRGYATPVDVLMEIGVREQTALDDACRIEHDISAESFAAIKEHIKKYSSEEKN